MKIKFITIVVFITYITAPSYSCTNYIVTKGASKDGSAFLAYTNDAEYISLLYHKPAAKHKAGETIEYFNSAYNIRGKINQAAETYATVGFHINEFQLAIGETTFTGREELWNHSKYLEYWHLMQLALERAKTAREAVKVIIGLVEEYGYASEGESISIVDPNEAWLLEIVGTGTGGEGAIWVALKIPDGYVCAHANMSRISEFPLNDSENCLYSKNVISYAIEKGYYNSKSGEPFRFNAAYCPADPEKLRYCESRVWSMFRRTSPSLKLSADYNRGVVGAQPYPLWIKPDNKMDLKDVFGIIRDHYEGTEMDMTKGIEAGPFGNPNHLRPLSWEYNNTKYCWERPISTFNSAFTFVAQMRSWLPAKVGGVLWYGVDDSYVSCYAPLYCGINKVPAAFATGDIKKYSRQSAWWVFNFVSNYINLRYSYMIKDLQAVQTELEDKFIAEDKIITETASDLFKKSEKKAIAYLTDYSLKQTDYMIKRWIELGEALITKYNDGYIKDENGVPKAVGYPDEWKKRVIDENPDKHKLPEWKKYKKNENLPY